MGYQPLLNDLADDKDALARAFAAHDRTAFEEAYRRYGALLYSVAYNVLHNTDDAQDCVHDSLVRVWRNARAYSQQRGALRSFLAVCVRNEAISRQRTATRRSRLSERMEREATVSEEFAIEDFVENRRLHDALATLPEEQRLPLLLAYFRGKTHVEIAQELGAPLGTIKSRISHGLRKLGSTLQVETAP